MRPLGAVAVGLFALVTAACPVRVPGQPAVGAPPVEGFDEAKLIDVLSPDGIASIDDPALEGTEPAGEWLGRDDPVMSVVRDGDARAYPLAILTQHEIVNDVVGATPVAVTFCPLCNSGVVYERSVGGRTLEFGVSGKLYLSDLVMYDRATHSLWPQILGRAVLGDLKGTRLAVVPSVLTSFGEFREAYPSGRVLARPAARAYGGNPYAGYDSAGGPNQSFFTGAADGRLPSMERVVGVVLGTNARAYPFARLGKPGKPAVLRDRLGDTEFVVFWGGSARSALDTAVIAEGRAVGSSGVYEPRAGARSLSFAVRSGRIVDNETGSTWSILGRALAGPLEGHELVPLHHLDAFWFAWAAFVPFTTVWDGGR